MRTRLACLLSLVAAWIVIPAAAPLFHFELIRSTPAANVTVKTAPARLQLWFSQVPAAGVSQLSLKKDSTDVDLGKTVIVAAEKSMYADPAKPLAAGKYTLHWRGAGDDGHVQQGDIIFTIAAKLPVIFARWVLYTSALGVIGAFGATLLSFPAHPRVISAGKRMPLGLLLGGFLLITAQLYNWFGDEGFTDVENLKTMLSITLWGLHWSWLAGVSMAVAFALPLAARWPSSWIFVSGVSALGVVAVVPLVGHGGTHDQWLLLAHRIHLLGAGLWIGSLAVALLSGISHTSDLLTRLRRFAPYALTGASLIAASGAVLAWKHVQPFSVIWTTTYGRILIAKIAGALVVAGLGFVNWRGPRVRVVVAEVLVAVLVVLSLTAWLSEVEMPMKH